MTRVTGVSASEWLKHMVQPFQIGMVLQAAGGSNVMAPANSQAVGNYAQAAAAAATSGTNPGSIFEGLQTIVDLSRSRAHYNPLDPEGTGNKQHFLQFTQNVADAPMLSLIKADTTEVSEHSQNSDKLIDAFVGAFVGIATENVQEITSSVKQLASAALSYSDKSQRFSNFVQNLMQTDSSGNVICHLYSSTFQISKSEHKGTIKFESNYSVLRAVYQLSPASWDQVKDLFANTKKQDTSGWINSMKTPNKGEGGAIATCLI